MAEEETKSSTNELKAIGEQDDQPSQAKINDNVNPICRECIRWEKYGEKCHYWWKGKSYCSRRVTSMEELEQENLFLG